MRRHLINTPISKVFRTVRFYSKILPPNGDRAITALRSLTCWIGCTTRTVPSARRVGPRGRLCGLGRGYSFAKLGLRSRFYLRLIGRCPDEPVCRTCPYHFVKERIAAGVRPCHLHDIIRAAVDRAQAWPNFPTQVSGWDCYLKGLCWPKATL